MARAELIIFDWDGTLMDSLAHIVASVMAAARVLGVPEPTETAARDIIGLGLPEALRILFPQITEADRVKLKQHYAQHFIAGHEQRSRPYAGAEQVLQSLRAQGGRLAVATGKSRLGLDRVLDHTGWHDYFEATRCADETASKPDPQMLLELLHELNVPVASAVMVGDTTYDMAMAEAIGMPRVGVTYGVHDEQRLQQHKPMALCHDTRSLQEVLLSLTRQP